MRHAQRMIVIVLGTEQYLSWKLRLENSGTAQPDHITDSRIDRIGHADSRSEAARELNRNGRLEALHFFCEVCKEA
jgi:hypothetical protein